MLYSPLTLIIGRQDLYYGTGLIVGPGMCQDPENVLKYDDLSPVSGYDAVRAILDYDPWTLDLLMAKMAEEDEGTTTSRDSDTDLYGVNLGYRFGSYNAEMEGYLFYLRDQNYDLTVYHQDNTANYVFEDTDVYTGGLRASLVPTENLSVRAEIAAQWGEIRDNGDTSNPNSADIERDREAMAVNVAGNYNFANVRFNPTLGVEYLYLSGEEVGSSDTAVEREYNDTSDFEAWHPIYRGMAMGTIRDNLEIYYATNDPEDTTGCTNQHTVKASGSLDLGELVDGLSLNLAYLHYWFDEEPSLTNKEDDIGDEIDLTVTYDYTEDVRFALDGALFIPGDYYDLVHTTSYNMLGGSVNAGGTTVTNRVSNDPCLSIVGSCTVTF
jgi:hypothetical protein